MTRDDNNHDAAVMCGQWSGVSFNMKRCYKVATLKAVAPATGYAELFCSRHASFVRKAQGSSVFASLVHHGVATLTEVR